MPNILSRQEIEKRLDGIAIEPREPDTWPEMGMEGGVCLCEIVREIAYLPSGVFLVARGHECWCRFCGSRVLPDPQNTSGHDSSCLWLRAQKYMGGGACQDT